MNILLALVMLVSSVAPQPQENCRCKPVTADETTRLGGNQSIVVKEEKVHRRVVGVVTYADDKPVCDALLEVFTHPEYLLLEYPESQKKKKKQRRIDACLTGDNGRFCFSFLPPGKYEIRVSQGSGINVTHIYIEVDPYAVEGTDDEITAVLTPGT